MNPIRRSLYILTAWALAFLLFPTPGAVRDVPFPSKHTVDGTFDGAYSTYAADIDGDGDLDLLGAAIVADEVAWWRNNNGSGTSWSKYPMPDAFDGACSVYAADIDGDGDQDILGAAFDADDIAWWGNDNGIGTTWTRHDVDLDFDGAGSVYAADMDGDGDADVLGTASNADDITWWENDNGVGTAWTEHTVHGTLDGAMAVRAADVDGDGNMDVLGAAPVTGDVIWFENTAGDGSVWSTHPVGGAFAGPSSVYAADIDGDGDLDILGAATTSNAIAWWENDNGAGTAWTQHEVDGTFNGAVFVRTADLDGDGDTDIFGAASVAGDVTWFENTASDGSAWAEHTVDGSLGTPQSVEAGDIDGDGDLDILGAAYGDDDITWWENKAIHRSATYPAEHTVKDTYDRALAVYGADLDGDGDQDILGASGWDNSVTWWKNTAGDGSAWTEHPIDSAFGYANAAHAADIDGDGDLDAISTANADGDLTWWENSAGNGTTWNEHTADGDISGPMSPYAADIDGDGDQDLLAAAYDADTIAWWENTLGTGDSWTEHVVDSSFSEASAVQPGDLDGDGDMDIVGAANAGSEIAWWQNTNGLGTAWSKVVIQDEFWGALSVRVADINGDGDLDVLGASGAGWAITWWENTLGDGSTWSWEFVDLYFPHAHWVDAADMDGDGDQDILGAAVLGDEITWWENLNGSGTSWTEHTVKGNYDGAIAAVAADVDGDGDQDLLGAAAEADDITWWNNQGGQFALATTNTAPVSLIAGHITDVLKVTMAHRGRAGDSVAELATLELLFEESPGDPLTSDEANAVIGKLHVYLDDGSETFESTLDTLVTTLDTLALTNGKQTVAFIDGDPKVQVACCTPRTYFVAPELTIDAYFQNPHQFQITHVTEGSSTAEDQANDLPLAMEYVPSLSSPVAARPEITATVDPGVTTTLAYTDSQGASTTITVPPGAVSQTITLIMSPAPEPSQPALPTLRYANHAFDLDAWKSRQLLPGLIFTEPISIGINYTDADVVWVYEDTLRLYYWDGGTWVDAASTCSPSSSYSRDLVQNTLSVEICHLTEYNIQGGPIPSSLVYLPLIFRQATQAKMLLASPRPVLNMFLRTQP